MSQHSDMQTALLVQVFAHFGNVGIHLRELHASVRPNHSVNGQAALDHQEQEARRILASAQADGMKKTVAGLRAATV